MDPCTYRSFGISSLMIHIGGLSFLGLGLQPETPELGMIIKEGCTVFPDMAHLVLLASALMTLIVVSLTVTSDVLRDTYDPRSGS